MQPDKWEVENIGTDDREGAFVVNRNDSFFCITNHRDKAERIAACLSACGAWSTEVIRERGVELASLLPGGRP